MRRVASCACGLVLVLSGCQKVPPGGLATPMALKDPPVYFPAETPGDELYGETGGEAVLPADPVPGSFLRSRKNDAFFKIANPRLEPVGKKPFPYLALDYERVREGHGGQSLVVRDARGQDRVFLIMGPMAARSGTLEIPLGFPRPGEPPFPNQAELFFTRQEHRTGTSFVPTFKVSNSVLLGSNSQPITQARLWTDEEKRQLQKPPFELTPNRHEGIGQDSELVGDASGGGKFRYVLPGQAMKGVDYWAGEWDGEPCLARLIPVYSADQPSGGPNRRLAPPGFAVAGMQVKTRRYVNGVKLLFMKILPDGQLDPRERSASEWLGPAEAGTKEVELGYQGKRVIGLHCRQGGILNAIALVRE